MTSPSPAGAHETTVCYRHPDRPAGVQCQRCDRVICPQCMHQASVGAHCPECTKKGRQKVYTRQNLPGVAGNGAPGMVTNALIALNVAAFVLQLTVFNANLFSAGSAPVEAALNGRRIAVDGDWWRIFSSGFLHIGILHLGMNMFSLYRIGPVLEQRLGSVKFGLAYMVSLLGGSFGALFLSPRAFTLGASGAIFGLLGLLVVMFRSRGIGLQQSGLADVLMLNLFISLSGYVSLGGHAGGFIIGGLLGVMYFGLNPGDGPFFDRDQIKADGATAAIGVVLFVGCLWAATRWNQALSLLGF